MKLPGGYRDEQQCNGEGSQRALHPRYISIRMYRDEWGKPPLQWLDYTLPRGECRGRREMNDTTSGATDDASTDKCCDNPNISRLPTRSAKLPGRRHRETYHECLNCGASWGAQ